MNEDISDLPTQSEEDISELQVSQLRKNLADIFVIEHRDLSPGSVAVTHAKTTDGGEVRLWHLGGAAPDAAEWQVSYRRQPDQPLRAGTNGSQTERPSFDYEITGSGVVREAYVKEREPRLVTVSQFEGLVEILQQLRPASST